MNKELSILSSDLVLRKSWKLFYTIIAVLIFIPTPLLADENSTSTDADISSTLTCTSNAKASRVYGFPEKAWIREIGEPSEEFSIGTKAKRVDFT